MELPKKSLIFGPKIHFVGSKKDPFKDKEHSKNLLFGRGYFVSPCYVVNSWSGVNLCYYIRQWYGFSPSYGGVYPKLTMFTRVMVLSCVMVLDRVPLTEVKQFVTEVKCLLLMN